MRQHHDDTTQHTTALANELRIYREALSRLWARIGWQKLRRSLVPWLLALVLLVGPNSPLALINPNVAFAHGGGSTPRGAKGTPNTFGDYLKRLQAAAAKPRHLAQASAGGPTIKAGTLSAPAPLQRPFRPSMKEGTLPLVPGQAASFTGSDGALRVDVPAGAVTSADVAAAGGTISLRIDQVASGSGASAGGSGSVSLGMYLLQLLNGQGQRVSLALHKPITLTLTYGKRELGLNLAHSFLVVDGPRPVNLPLAPLAAPAPTASPTPTATTTTPAGHVGSKGTSSKGTASKASPTATRHGPTSTPSASNGSGSGNASGGLGPIQAIPTTHDAAHHTLSAPLPLTSTATADFDTFSSVGTFGSPDPFTADLSGGGVTSDIPIEVPPGPGGLTPPIHLGYSSATVSGQHNVQGAAGWVGEGWSLSLGAVTWAEHDVTADCLSTCGANWENSWQISDPFGMGANLIPPNNTVSTYYDDTTNTYFDGTNYHNMPSQWHSSAENYAKIISYVGPNTIQTQQAKPPCFRAWLTNGIMEEFGCTTDSLEYYETSTGDRLTAWNLDLITDPRGNQIHITYQSDTTQGFPRDVELHTVEYDSPGCQNANTACTGSAWAPQVRVGGVGGH
jgi:hypothetical protein